MRGAAFEGFGTDLSQIRGAKWDPKYRSPPEYLIPEYHCYCSFVARRIFRCLHRHEYCHSCRALVFPVQGFDCGTLHCNQSEN